MTLLHLTLLHLYLPKAICNFELQWITQTSCNDRALLQRRRGSRADPVSEDDVLRAIGKLKALGSGFQVIKVGSQKLVRSVPGELNTDKSILLELAQGLGYVSEAQIEQVY